MNTEPQINNRMFRDTVIGVLLLIAAFAFAMIESAHPHSFQTTYVLIISALGSMALFVLYKAIRADRYRIDEAE